MDQRQQIEELLPFYVLDALTDEERELVEAYLAEHPEVREQLGELHAAASALPYAVAPVEPPRRLKDALMARVAVDQRLQTPVAKKVSSPGVRRWTNLFPVFSFAVAIVAVVWAVILNFQVSQLRHDVSSLGDALVAQSNSLEQINAKLPQTPASVVVTISLKGTEARPQAHGELIADPKSVSAVMVVTGLGQLEVGKTYQVWLIDAGGPKSAGLLTVDANGQAVLIVTSDTAIGSFKSLGISVEPTGGSPQPTGDIVVLSDL
ncbi:MAG: anti-sigma factor [Chloroflexota bacterium]